MSGVNIEGVNSESLDSILRIDDLHKTFVTRSRGRKISTYALRGVSFSIKQGEAVGIVGESGCGKSTLARLIAGLETSTRGSMSFNNMPMRFTKALRKKISMVFQDPYASLNPRMSTASCVREPMHLLSKEELKVKLDKIYEEKPEEEWTTIPRGFLKRFFLKFESKRALAEKTYASRLLELVQLRPEWSVRYPHEFSGGQRQRIGIARALATSPDLLILDEPVSALDVSVQAGIISLLAKLQEENELAMLFISHDLRVVKHICDRVIVMYLGQIMEDASSELLFSRPRHPYTKALIASIPKAKLHERTKGYKAEKQENVHVGSEIPVRVLKGEIPSPTNPPQGCPFRTRCEKATDECLQKPPLAKMTDGRLIACHFPY